MPTIIIRSWCTADTERDCWLPTKAIDQRLTMTMRWLMTGLTTAMTKDMSRVPSRRLWGDCVLKHILSSAIHDNKQTRIRTIAAYHYEPSQSDCFFKFFTSPNYHHFELVPSTNSTTSSTMFSFMFRICLCNYFYNVPNDERRKETP